MVLFEQRRPINISRLKGAYDFVVFLSIIIFWRMDEDQIKKMKVAELRTELGNRSLPISGKKEELITRLIEAISTTKEPLMTSQGPSTSQTASKIRMETPVKRPASPQTVNGASEKDKLEERAARFGIQSNLPKEDDRIKKRQERFGKLEKGGMSGKLIELGEDVETLRQRQQRFGETLSSTLVLKDLEEQRLRRLERFGS